MSQNANTMLPIGTTLQGGKYRVEKPLSSGGFGNTYIVTNTKFDERYAMKEFFMKDACERDNRNTVSVSNPGNRESFAQQREKFNKEAQRIRKLNNAHIVKVHDLFDENGTSYYVMDYLDGGSLFDRMRHSGKAFSEQEVLRFLPQILDGLEAVHNQHLWHLDLHPKNIMLDQTGNIVLIDFGASKQMSPDNSFSTSSALCYHFGYAPTEQIEQNLMRIGAWTDFYALGATLYNLLTNQPPLSVSDIQDGEEFYYSHPVSTRMQKLIRWLMQPNRKRRPQTVEEVREWLNDPKTATAPNRPSPAPSSDETTFTQFIQENAIYSREQRTVSESPTDETTVFDQRIDDRMHQDTSIGKSTWSHGDLATNPYRVNSSAPSEIITVNGVSFKMIRVEGGTFKMGSTSLLNWLTKKAEEDERPAHQVTLSTYYIGETEVTQELWKAVMGSNPSNFKGANLPVEQVNWDDCQTFIRKLNSLTGKTFRLPTEAEWEFAARGGNKSQGYKYSGSNTLVNVAWYIDNSGNKTHPVKTKSPNELGIYDMSGNVWEWCQDWYGSYSSASQTNPTGPSSGSLRVCRGGSWNNRSSARSCRVSYRGYDAPDDLGRSYYLGLRLAL